VRFLKAIRDFFKRGFANISERRDRSTREGERVKRWRQRVSEWEKSLSRRKRDSTEAFPVHGSRARSTCPFCETVRSLVASWFLRLLSASRSLSRQITTLIARARSGSKLADSARRAVTSKRVFRARSYPGSRTRRFELHLPRGYNDSSRVPLLMVLHGCRQTSADIRRIANFDAIADREGFIVAYPFVTGYSGMRIRNCWGWWLDGEIRPGAGEVEDIWQIAEQIRGEFSIDARRIHIAGLSSGGGMAVAAMVAHAGKFASGAAVAGVAYSETARAVSYGAPTGATFKPTQEVVSAMRSVIGKDGRPSPIFVVHSTQDAVVDIQAARNIRDSWAGCVDIDTTRPDWKRSGTTDGAPWTHMKYRRSGRRSHIETLFIEGLGHGWYGGNPGKFSYPAAPDISGLIWRFLKRHPLHSGSRNATGRVPVLEAS